MIASEKGWRPGVRGCVGGEGGGAAAPSSQFEAKQRDGFNRV